MYAVCTHPSFQGRGLMSELINESINREFAKGVKAILCVPSTKRLFDFYYRFGFTDGIYSSSFFYDRESLGKLSSKCDYRKNRNLNELNAVRNNLLKSKAFVSFPDKYMSLCDGFGLSYIYGESFYAIYIETDKTVETLDCFWKNENGKNEMLFALTENTDAERISIEFPGEQNLMGLIRFSDGSININNIYLGINMG